MKDVNVIITLVGIILVIIFEPMIEHLFSIIIKYYKRTKLEKFEYPCTYKEYRKSHPLDIWNDPIYVISATLSIIVAGILLCAIFIHMLQST